MTRPMETGESLHDCDAAWLRDWQLVVFLTAAVFIAYLPAWHGGFIWDDEAHVTKPELQSFGGLYRIWFELGATQQYYPLLHSAFWIQHRLWGDSPLGYHLVNIGLHAMAALLAAILLRRLKIPGAWLAAAVFALHPVHVESVAWISELKNTLSAVFYLSAALAYLRFDQTRKPSAYGLAMALFLLGLMSKTVTATLPGALLVVFWWQRGRIEWKRDVLPLLPFFAVGAVAGVCTALVERHLIGAKGEQFDLSLVERLLLAGRAPWFYLSKLLWPANLLFIYPRWRLDPTAAWQYLFPAASLLALAALWRLRTRWRGPLAGALFFLGTLFPVLGFCNVYPFLFSYVADHFQYLASLGAIVPLCAGATLLFNRGSTGRRAAGYALAGLLLCTLAALTWRQASMYTDVETLYRKTIARNPDCWMAHNNLGIVLGRDKRLEEAQQSLQKALEIRPKNNANIHNNLGGVLKLKGQFEEAAAHFELAIREKPDSIVFHMNLANTLSALNRTDDAASHYRRVLELDRDYPDANNNLGMIHLRRGETETAIPLFRNALRAHPDCIEARCNLGDALSRQGEFSKAVTQWREALRVQPNFAMAADHLAWTLATCSDASLRNAPAAVELAQRTVRLTNGGDPAPLDTLAAAYAEAGRFADAVEIARRAYSLAQAQENKHLAEAILARIKLYEAEKPYRESHAELRD